MCSRPSLNITLNVSIDLDRVFDTRVTRENLFTEWSRHETRLTSVIQYTEIKTRLWFSLTRFPDVLWTLDKAIAKLFCHSVDVLESKVFYRGGIFNIFSTTLEIRKYSQNSLKQSHLSMFLVIKCCVKEQTPLYYLGSGTFGRDYWSGDF